ncbi:glutamyl-tRNA reductase [Conexibacter woesei]|uniref:Glutamyl-tRNA reductase n=1 Tax=Conexibacter woesei (strain DSM 14684 / CCUG 47730 / CIP 108061 / JCM 11494 / NBRC 100937 / ID131577) TaxID=469383 RepID=D3F2Z7_CONWI|nr:glutamyl-tRNA reductase [Conexibacter woesei]ADB54278.1 glutamyl-tRNA reductase [Conexibacter woesei DSM 14684]
MSEVLGIGVSHKTAPVAVRERLALTPGKVEAFLRDTLGVADVQEAVAISTCNRTEVYVVASDPVEAETRVLGMLARKAGIRPTELAGSIYALRNCDAARHLYRVTSGLESMIVGEAEVQGQVKRAYDDALAAQSTGPLTNHLFRAALATGKRVRSETRLGERRLSVSSIAAALAAEQLSGLERREVLLVGAGETSELAARALADHGVEAIFVANRRRDRAISLAQRFGGQATSFDALPQELERADAVICTTSSPHPILEAEEVAAVMDARDGRALLIIDLAVPRDVASDVRHVPGVALYNVDDLQSVVRRNRSVRQVEAQHAEGIVEEEIQRFAEWLGSLEVLPTVGALRAQGQAIAEQIVRENAGRWESASEKDLERIEALAQAVVNRILHEPTLRMKGMSDDRVHLRMQVVRDLFGLEDVPEGIEAEQPLAEVRQLRRRDAPPA